MLSPEGRHSVCESGGDLLAITAQHQCVQVLHKAQGNESGQRHAPALSVRAIW